MANSSKWLPNVEGTVKAWANLNGTGTIAGRDDFSISSYTDSGVGQYLANLTTAMANANFASPACAGDATNAAVIGGQDLQTASATSVHAVSRIDSTGHIDVAFVFVSALGDLA